MNDSEFEEILPIPLLHERILSMGMTTLTLSFLIHAIGLGKTITYPGHLLCIVKGSEKPVCQPYFRTFPVSCHAIWVEGKVKRKVYPVDRNTCEVTLY
jgi:hypothetical protein